MASTLHSYEPVRDHDRAATGRYTLLALLCTAATIAYVQRSGIAVAAGAIQGDLNLDKVQLGAVMAAWSLGYAIGQIPSGWLADAWGSRKALTLYAVLWSIATGMVALASDYVSLLVLWSLMGLAQAGIFPCATRSISRSFAPERRASSSGLLGTFMNVGGAVAPTLTGLLLSVISWRWIFVLYALPGIAWALLFYSWVRQIPRDTERQNIEAAPGARDAPSYVWGRMFFSASMWLLCAQQFLRAAATIFFATWFPTFLRESRGASVVQSGFLTTLAAVGAVLGSLLGGFASDKVLIATGSLRLSRQGIAVAGMAACTILILCAYFVADTTLAVAILSVGTFCGTFGGVSGYTTAMDLGGRRVATVFSVMNMCGNIGAAVFPLAVGWLVQWTGNWDLVLFVFAGIFAAAGVCWALLNPKQPLFEEA